MRVMVLAIVVALATSAAASPVVRRSAAEPPSPVSLQRVSLPCLDSSLGAGSCPSQLQQCKMDCDDEFAYDTLRCMAGAGGLAPVLRAICHGKAFSIYSQCLRDCGDIYG